MAGIGNRLGARSIIVDNESRENKKAGIGVRNPETVAVIVGNRCLENRLIAIGLPDGATGYIHGNELQRTGGGAPPLVAFKGRAKGVVSHNSIRGGGVAGLLAQGEIQILGNRFQGKGPGQGSAIWVWKDSQITAVNNHVQGYRNAINASGSQVTATRNVTRDFEGPSLIVKKSASPSYVIGNTAISNNPKNTAAQVDGENTSSLENVLKKPNDDDAIQYPNPSAWPMLSHDGQGESFHPLANTNTQLEVREGPWKLVVTYGKKPQYALFYAESDPSGKLDLSAPLEQITFRLRGLIEKQEGKNTKP